MKLDTLQDAARARNIELSIHRVASGVEIAAAIDMAQASGAAALNVLASPILYASRQIIMDRVAALRLPTMFIFPEDAEDGGFVGYGPRLMELWRDVYLDSSRSSSAAPGSLTSRSNSRPSLSW